MFFSFNRFDATNPAPADELMASFPRLRFMLPEIVLIENERGRFLQVNSLGPVYPGRVARFTRMVASAPTRQRTSIPFALEPDSREAWGEAMDAALAAIGEGRVSKVVLSRRLCLAAEHPFSSKDLLVNLIDGDARGTVLLYRYADVFFCGCTPELSCASATMWWSRCVWRGRALPELRRRNRTRWQRRFWPMGRTARARLCGAAHSQRSRPRLLRRGRACHSRDHAACPCAAPVHAGPRPRARRHHAGRPHGRPASHPAVAGTPVGEAKMLLRAIEPYNRGFYAGACGSWTAPATASSPLPCAPAFSTARWVMCTAAAVSSAKAMRTPSTRKSI